jgi:AraC-like DNA-binding protein
MSENSLVNLNAVDDRLTGSSEAENVSGLDDQLVKSLSQIPIFFHANFFDWFTKFLDAEHIDAPVTRLFLNTWRGRSRISILSLVNFLSLLEQEAYQTQSIHIQSSQTQTPQTLMVFQIARHASIQYSDVLGYLCLSGQNFGDMLAKFQRYYSLMFEGLDIQINVDQQFVVLNCMLPPKLKELLLNHRIVATLSELCFASIFTVVKRFFKIKQSIYTELEFPSEEPKNVDIYRHFFECPVIFNCENPSVKIALSLMSQPLNMSNELLPMLIESRSNAEMGLLPEMLKDPFICELQDNIFQSIKERSPNIDYVADKMAISRASLQRRLKERNHNFSEMLDHTRLNLAKFYLEQKKLSLTEIAWLLGFSDQTAFSRSFKRWLGMSPLEFRRLF